MLRCVKEHLDRQERKVEWSPKKAGISVGRIQSRCGEVKGLVRVNIVVECGVGSMVAGNHEEEDLRVTEAAAEMDRG